MFYFQFRGKKIPTGVADEADVAGAQAAMERIIGELIEKAAAGAARGVFERAAARPEPPPIIPNPTPTPTDARTVASAVRDYLSHFDRKVAAGRGTAKCRTDYGYALDRLAADLGHRPLGELEAEELERWADRPEWSASTRCTYLGTVQTMLRHHRVSLPVKKPHKESRGDTCILTDEQFATVLEDVERCRGPRGDLADLLRILRETGARPQEVSRLTAADVDWENCCVRHRKHKTKAKTGRDRVIHFNAAAMGVLRAARLRHPEGFLFPTRSGRHYTPEVLVRRMLTVSKRVGFRAIAYGLGRHSFATNALAQGIPDAIVAELLGHRGTAMLQFHYSHLGSQARVLKDAVERVNRPKAG